VYVRLQLLVVGITGVDVDSLGIEVVQRNWPKGSFCAANQRFNAGISAGSTGKVELVIALPPFGMILARCL
jgi:predicted RNA methylase